MKKVLIIVVISVTFGLILYQSLGRMFLILLSQHQLSNPFQTTASNSSVSKVKYKNGKYTGVASDAFYGTVQVKAVIQNEKISNVIFLQHPDNALRSVAINTFAMPNLIQEAIQAQSANVNIVSGATATSQAFVASLQSALSKIN